MENNYEEIYEQVKAQNETTVIAIRALYNMFIEWNFTEDQALKLTISMLDHIDK